MTIVGSIGHLQNLCKPQHLSLLNTTAGCRIVSHLIFFHGFYGWPNSRLYFEFLGDPKAKHRSQLLYIYVPIPWLLSRCSVTNQIKGLKRYSIQPICNMFCLLQQNGLLTVYIIQIFHFLTYSISS